MRLVNTRQTHTHKQMDQKTKNRTNKPIEKNTLSFDSMYKEKEKEEWHKKDRPTTTTTTISTLQIYEVE